MNIRSSNFAVNLRHLSRLPGWGFARLHGLWKRNVLSSFNSLSLDVRLDTQGYSPTPSSAPKRIVCFAPYSSFLLHAAWETTILHGLNVRGHDTKYVTCDGILSQCDVFRFVGTDYAKSSLGPNGEKSPAACRDCQRSVAASMKAASLPHVGIGNWLTDGERKRAQAWARELPVENLADATFENWSIAEWVTSSVVTHFRANRLDLDQPGVEVIFRRYLASGLASCFAIDRMLHEEAPDTLLLFNGRMSVTRIAFELAQRRGIRVVVEERGMDTGQIRLLENRNCLSVDGVDEVWSGWKNTPLSATEIEQLDKLLTERFEATSEAFVFSPAQTTGAEIRRQLDLDDRPVWALFTSSIDESASEPHSAGLFSSQPKWIEAVIAYAGENPEIQLVVRVHPNIGSMRSLGSNQEDIAFFANLSENTPPNVRIVQSHEEVSSYSLINIADVGLVWHSTIGIEMACRGRRVLRSGSFFLRDREFLVPLAEGETFTSTLDKLKTPWPSQALFENTRTALRFAYVWYFRQSLPFPQVTQPEWFSGAYAFDKIEALAPGKSPEFDRIIEVVTGEGPFYSSPGSAEKARTEDAEDTYIHQLLPGKQAQS